MNKIETFAKSPVYRKSIRIAAVLCGIATAVNCIIAPDGNTPLKLLSCFTLCVILDMENNG